MVREVEIHQLISGEKLSNVIKSENKTALNGYLSDKTVKVGQCILEH